VTLEEYMSAAGMGEQYTLKKYEEAKAAFRAVDLNQDGEITLNEAMDAQMRARQGLDVSQPKVAAYIKTQFDKLDIDGSGINRLYY
jgi:Ca2+-binding EF-hand superfamily protein